MSKVITFSRYFPATHPQKGEPTYFVEKLWKGLQTVGYSEPQYFFNDYLENKELEGLESVINLEEYQKVLPKLHTIRAGNRFKAGEYFSPRVWSGKPYYSKQIIIAPDVKITNVYDICFVQADELLVIGEYSFSPNGYEETIAKLAMNDGLTVEQFKKWFAKPFDGQIICWGDVQY